MTICNMFKGPTLAWDGCGGAGSGGRFMSVGVGEMLLLRSFNVVLVVVNALPLMWYTTILVDTIALFGVVCLSHI